MLLAMISFAHVLQFQLRTIFTHNQEPSGLENSTRPLVFTSTSGCRASENFDIFSENFFFPIYVNNFCGAGQVPIFRYFEAWPLVISCVK